MNNEDTNLNGLKPDLDITKSDNEIKDIRTETKSKEVFIKPGTDFNAPQKFTSKQILKELINQLQKVDFRLLARLDDKEKLNAKHFMVYSIQEIIKTAIDRNWGLCKLNGFTYVYTGSYWQLIDTPEMENFLGEAAEKIGVLQVNARLYSFREQLLKQFVSASYLSTPEQNGNVLINFSNGTFEINSKKQFLRDPKREDFLKYELPFVYDPEAKSPLFEAYLNQVQPDAKIQMILAEYIGYIFINPNELKLEKTLLNYGTGANGKSVFFEIVSAMLGGNVNVSNFSLQSLTNENGYYRAMLANKLLNYASEINGKLEASIFKQLVSGEPIEARLPYGDPFMLYNYAKLIFNCNELPKDVEHTHAFFRRFLIIPWSVTIPESDQDKELPKKIIAKELPGVFNWVLEGLKRLLLQKNFTQSDIVDNQINTYKKESDSVAMFLEDSQYLPSSQDYKPLKEVYNDYKMFAIDNGYHKCSNKTFSERLRKLGFKIERKNFGMAIWIEKKDVF